MNILCFIQRLNVLYWGVEEARKNESSLLALDTTTITNLLHALRGPDCPFRWERQIILSGSGQIWGPVYFLYGGSDDSAPGLRCLKTFGSTAESRRLLVWFASWVFAEMTLQLASLSDIRPASCHWLNYCLLGFISFFFFSC